MLRAEQVDLCIEFLHWSAKQRDGLPGAAEGTTLPAATKALVQVGQPLEATWPYNEHRDQWASDYHPPADAYAAAPARRVAISEELLATATALHDALDRGRAVLLGVRLHMSWFEVDTDGRIAMPVVGASDFGGHAVLVVGYQDDVLIVRNSWGADWGAGGYAYLPNAYVDAFGVGAWALATQE